MTEIKRQVDKAVNVLMEQFKQELKEREKENQEIISREKSIITDKYERMIVQIKDGYESIISEIKEKVKEENERTSKDYKKEIDKYVLIIKDLKGEIEKQKEEIKKFMALDLEKQQLEVRKEQDRIRRYEEKKSYDMTKIPASVRENMDTPFQIQKKNNVSFEEEFSLEDLIPSDDN